MADAFQITEVLTNKTVRSLVAQTFPQQTIRNWEFGFSGSPLLDVGNFLRYERFDRPIREPHFSKAFVSHGGRLPENWREIARLIDLAALVESLTHDDLPEEVVEEILELITATLEHRDPG